MTWALLGLLLMLGLFPGMDKMSASVSRLPFMKINPRYSGGMVMQSISNENCTLNIRKPVFNGFLKELESGFVQLDWHGNVPEIIKDSIDYDQDGIKDFSISIDRKNNQSKIEAYNRKVTGIHISTRTSYGWALRVGLKQ